MRTRIRTAVVIGALLAQAPFASVCSQTDLDSTVVGWATAVPGVVEDGAEIVRLITGYNGLDDPIGLADGSLVFSEPDALRIHRIDPATNRVAVLVAESNESHGITQHADGHLISAQAWDGSTQIGVIYPPSAVRTLADSYRGQPFSRPNDVIVARNGGVYFTDPGLTREQAEELAAR
ncbi:MAG TPA: SMP-30/gluconolactonase/LRE family protein, partial [Gammaproteobacteria bacterium]|nr:SMP-30/gluconolactonase/LRE family protein [Gammaproteobacteria bacterium]